MNSRDFPRNQIPQGHEVERQERRGRSSTRAPNDTPSGRDAVGVELGYQGRQWHEVESDLPALRRAHAHLDLELGASQTDHFLPSAVGVQAGKGRFTHGEPSLGRGYFLWDAA
ncbi:MAG: hypothetical protein AB7I50_22490 [Vicinamibacterales bacterium]